MSRPHCCAREQSAVEHAPSSTRIVRTQLADVPQIPIGNVPENNVRRRGATMLTGELRNQIDSIWNDFWFGGLSSPAPD